MRATHSFLCAGLLLASAVQACGKLDKASDVTPSVDTEAQGPVVRYIGRVDATNPNLVLLAWPGTAVETRFNGTKISATVSLAKASRAAPTTAQTFVELTVDGKDPQRVLVATAGNTTVTANVPNGLHTARLTKATEPSFGTLNFLGFSAEGGTLTNTLLPQRRIEFIGDSITAGLGVLGTLPCDSLDPNVEHARAAYSNVAATALKADASLVAWSGKGAYLNQDANDSVALPALYPLTDPTDPASTYTFPTTAAEQPQVVVINLGTNDFARAANQIPSAFPDETLFGNALGGLADTVRARYPSAFVVLAIGPIVSNFASNAQIAGQLDKWRTYVQGVVAKRSAASDSKISFFEFNPLVDDAQKGCDSHPNVAAAQAMGAALQAHISGLTGWN